MKVHQLLFKLACLPADMDVEIACEGITTPVLDAAIEVVGNPAAGVENRTVVVIS